MHLSARRGDMSRPPGRDGPAIADDDSVIRAGACRVPGRQPAASSACRSRVARFSMSSRQSFMPACASCRKLRSSLRSSSGSSSCKVRAAIAYQADLHRIPQANALGIELDLHAARLSGLGQKFDDRERSADHQQCVAISPSLPGRLRTQQTNAAGGVRAVVRNGRFTQQRLDDRRTEQFGQTAPIRPWHPEHPPGKNRDLLAGIQHFGCAARDPSGCGKARASRIDIARCDAEHCAWNAAASLTSFS